MKNPFLPKEYGELPSAVWVPRNGLGVFRGAARDIVLQMATVVKGRPPDSTKEALQSLIKDLSQSSRIRVQISWGQPEDALAKGFLRAMLQLGICQPVPSA